MQVYESMQRWILCIDSVEIKKNKNRYILSACNLQTSLWRRTWPSPWEDLSIICPIPANCGCVCMRACALRCPCWSASLCFLTDMLPKVETRVVLVGEAGRNGALLKALQVFTPNPKAPRLPTVKYDQLLCGQKLLDYRGGRYPDRPEAVCSGAGWSLSPSWSTSRRVLMGDRSLLTAQTTVCSSPLSLRPHSSISWVHTQFSMYFWIWLMSAALSGNSEPHSQSWWKICPELRCLCGRVQSSI